jgi:alpha-ribazole phosphatase/probable phosphoglycerate mutase
MVTRLYLIRHGETEDADTKCYKGHIDVPLSEKGIKQMEQLSKYIYQNTEHRTQSTELKAVYCSDLNRALKSAEIIAEPHGIKPIVVKALRERNFGIWEGMSFDEIKERYPEEFKAWANNPLKFSPLGGESTLQVRDRVIDALDRILDEVQDSLSSSNRLNSLNDLNGLNNISIAIVAHGGINRIILCHFLGIPLENIFRIEQDFGALNIIEFHDGYPVIKLINGRWKMEYGI